MNQIVRLMTTFTEPESRVGLAIVSLFRGTRSPCDFLDFRFGVVYMVGTFDVTNGMAPD